MLRKTPPLESIEVFVAAAKSRSFRAVAEDMALSPSAISRRIAALEAFLGTALFDRDGLGVRLTAAGQRYLGFVEPAVAEIQQATSRLAGKYDEGPIRIAASSSLASNWLVPRVNKLDAFLGREVEFVLSRDFDSLRCGDAHFAIWGSLPTPEDFTSIEVCPIEVTPVVSPSVRHKSFEEQTLLSTEENQKHWNSWFQFENRLSKPEAYRMFPNNNLAYEAAAAGLGIALAVPLVSDNFLFGGTLEPCGPKRPTGSSYKFYSLRNADRHALPAKSLLKWLKSEMHSERNGSMVH